MYRRFSLVLPLLALFFAALALVAIPSAFAQAPSDAPLRILIGHTNRLRSVAVSPDGQTIVSGSDDYTIRLWNLSDGMLVRTLTGHTSYVTSVAVSPDGQTIVSGSDDYTTRVWNVSDGMLVRTLTGHTSYVLGVAVSPDGQNIVSASNDNTVKVWNLSDGTLIRTLTEHASYVDGVAVSPDGQNIVSVSNDATVRVWRLADGACLDTLTGHNGRVYSVAISADGQYCASGGQDQTVRLWRLSDGVLVRTLVGHTSDVHSVAISPNGQYCVSGSLDNTVRVWQMSDGALLRTLIGHTGDVMSVAVSPNGQYCVSGGGYGDSTVRIWQLSGVSVSGTISTSTWTAANSPYRVTGTITVLSGNTLTIEPGADVLFDADVQFIVQGSLQAVGAESDSIRFIKGTASEWGGIRISGGQSNELAYTRISDANTSQKTTPASYGGGLHVEGAQTSLHMTHCTISGNSASDGGALYIETGASVMLEHCTVKGNTTTSYGGGLNVQIYSGSVALSYCLISGNSANYGGGMHASYGATLTNCTISGNSANQGGGFRQNEFSATSTLTNCILWANTANNGPQINRTAGTITVRYSDVQGGIPEGVTNGGGNIDLVPLFVNAAAGDYRLQPGSPCIGSGEGGVDMGAFTFHQEGAIEGLALPTVVIASGDSAEAAVTGTLDNAYSANLAFLMDAEVIERVSLVSSPFSYREINLSGDTAYVGLASASPVSVTGGEVVRLRFVVRSGAVRQVAPLTWLAYPETHVDDQAVALVAGSITVPNHPPVWAARPDTTTPEAQRLTFSVSTSDYDGDVLTYSAPTLPAGATFNADTRTFDWTPTYEQAGTHQAIFSVTDGFDAVNDTVSITVTNVNRAPVWTPTADKTVAAAQLLTFTVSATDPDGQSLTYDAPRLPTGATFTAATHTFSWTPTYEQAGVDTAIFSAADGQATVYDSVRITVSNTNRPPVWAARPDTTVKPTVPLVFLVSANDPDAGDVMTYSAPVFPKGASFDPGTRAFSWTAAYRQAGDTLVVFSVTDAQATVYDTVWISVTDYYGDVTLNGQITAEDASWVLRYSVKIRTEIVEEIADVTGNGRVTAFDAALILVRVLDPAYVFPARGGPFPGTKPAPTARLALSWVRDGSGWALRADHAGLLAGDLVLSLGNEAPVTVSGGDHLAFRQEGSTLRVAFVSLDGDEPVLLRFAGETLTDAPRIVRAELNEGQVSYTVERPATFALEQNVPNPFNPTTTLQFTIPTRGIVNLAIYDVNGRRIRTLVDGTVEAGMHEVVWDGQDSAGRNLASGVYLYRLTSGERTFVRRMVLLR